LKEDQCFIDNFLEPSNPIDLDLEACERNEDINFIFVGFQISGQVKHFYLHDNCVNSVCVSKFNLNLNFCDSLMIVGGECRHWTRSFWYYCCSNFQ